ncbi:MAG: cytochrome b [Betaproteobacteria bacterium]|nr:cytochrome b [Betaproteobacteria bacterium]
MAWKNDAGGWGRASILLHWLSALLVIGLFVVGNWMTGLAYTDQWYVTAPFLHKSFGLTLFLIMLVRVLWRIGSVTPNPLPSHSRFERTAARLAHVGLYVLLFATMISGYLISTADGRAISVFGLFEVPATISGLPGQEDIAGDFHYYLAVAVMVLAALHALAALKHHFVDRDSTLRRMLGCR